MPAQGRTLFNRELVQDHRAAGSFDRVGDF
jgi:hypothetical protein